MPSGGRCCWSRWASSCGPCTAPQTYFTFEDTLSQIGLGYPILFLLAFRPPRWQWIALAVILTGYWLAWALYPVPGPGFNWQAVGVPPDWQHYTGFAAHWNKNANLGTAFDQWFLNLFPRVRPFVANGGGYLTLSFIPTLGTMILGLFAGRWLRASAPQIPMKRLLLAGVIGIAAGLLLHFTGICPVVKRIWTPSWTLFSGGVCFLFLAGFSWIVDVKGYRKWAFPLVVIGMNSIAAYMIAHLFERFITDSFRINLGPHVVPDLRHGPRAVHARCGSAACLLADPVLDVPAQAFPKGLIHPSLAHATATHAMAYPALVLTVHRPHRRAVHLVAPEF